MPDKPTVVIVDDEEDIRQLIALSVDEHFEVVGEASDGQEAVSVVRKVDPDIVVMDLMMPHFDGLDAISEIKLVCPRSKIVVLTAAGRSLMAEAAGRGADAWVDKVKYRDELIGIMRSVIGIQVAPPQDDEE